MKAVPEITRGTTVTAINTPEGLRYRVKPAARGSGTVVPPRTLVALLLMDGERALDAIHQELLDLGVKMRDPAAIIRMTGVFEAAGVIRVQHAFSSPSPLRHACDGCGRSCEGHLVGPIEDDEAAVLQQRLDRLRASEPGVMESEATVVIRYEGDLKRVLNFPGGACVFLDENKLCRLHATWGAMSKPLPCRMFPYRLVRSETGTRISISPRCFRGHRSYQREEVANSDDLMADWGVWRPPAVVQGLDAAKEESLEPTPAAVSNVGHEARLLSLLGEDRTWAELVSALGRRLPLGPPVVPGPDRLDAFGGALYAQITALLGQRFDTDGSQVKTAFAGSVRRLIKGIEGLAEDSLPDWTDLPAPALEYVRFALKNWVFSRELMIYGTVLRGTLTFVMGVAAARWLSDREDLVAGNLDPFVEVLSAWIRTTSSNEVVDILYSDSTRVDQLLDMLA